MTSLTKFTSYKTCITELAAWFVICLFHTSLASAENMRADFMAPGKMVNIGTHKMHLNCQGNVSPTVVIDSGLGGFSLEWDAIQKQVSKQNRVCTYDRSGYGWSEESPNTRTTKNIAEELYLLLITAEIPGPYIMVGHSFGGYNIRYFASQHPTMVAGLVFVDASHPEQNSRMPKLQTVVAIEDKRKGWQIKLAMPMLSDNYPETHRNVAYFLMSSYKSRRTQLQEREQFITSAGQVLKNDHLPDVPVTVITRGKRVWPMNEFGDASEKVWQELQGELTALSHHSKQLLAYQSGHAIHLDQPALVYSAISDTVMSSRENQKPVQLPELLYVKQ